jgi:parallel beta-helix repeat protein
MRTLRQVIRKTSRVLFGCLVLLGVNGTRAADYYVGPQGDDSNPGTEEKPWQTIAKAAKTLGPGDAVYIMNGTYRERISPGKSGLPGKPIVYAVCPGHRAVIDGTGVALAERGGILGLVDIANKSHLRISGLHIVNTAGQMDAGIFVANSEHITLEKNHIANTGTSGICTWKCRNVVIDGNAVESVCTRGVNECISLMHTDTFEVRHNYVHNAPPSPIVGANQVRRKEGIDAKDGSSNGKIYGNRVHHTSLGIYVDARGSAHDIDIFGNVIHDIVSGFAEPGGKGTGTGSGIVLASETEGSLEKIRIWNNVIYNTHFGIRLAGYGNPGHPPMKHVTVINNTLYGNRRGIELSNKNAEGIVIRNNVCCHNQDFAIGVFKNSWGDVPRLALADPTLAIDHNLLDEGQTEKPWARDNVYGEPGFVNPEAGDFHLTKGSAAIDSGLSDDAPNVDFDENPRPQGGSHDIGAFEYSAPQQNAQIGRQEE